MAKPNVAIVEGDPIIALLMNEFLTEEGYNTHVWTRSGNASQFVRDTMPDLLILDLWIHRRGDGWNILEQLRQDRDTTSIPVIICSTDPQMTHRRDVERQGLSYARLQKPFAVADFLALVRQCLHQTSAPMLHEHPQISLRDRVSSQLYPVYDA